MSTEPASRRRYARGDDVEFARVVNFTDAVFAIAMTLLVVGIGIPAVSPGDSVTSMWDALGDKVGELVGFFVGFFVIGGYWLAHHRYFARLQSVDRGLIAINLAYLSLIAVLPFPTSLLGQYFENPLSPAIFALNAAAVSLLEVVSFRYAERHELFVRRLPDDVFRWGVMLSLVPVALFAISIPIAFLATWAAVVVWFLAVPAQIVAGRWKPTDADDYFD